MSTRMAAQHLLPGHRRRNRFITDDGVPRGGATAVPFSLDAVAIEDVLVSSNAQPARDADRRDETGRRWREPDLSRTLYSGVGKEILDRVLALAALTALLPVIGVTAVAVRLSLGRGVIFRQVRVGLHGSEFVMLKFRTMACDRRVSDVPYEGCDRRLTHKTECDPRHTALGRFLRRSSLDELPQLVNVLRGEMSLVGPRPEIATVVERYGLRDHPRHRVRPGITGLWQVSEYRGELLHLNMGLDIDYLEQLSLRTDLRILWATVTRGVGGV
jgi:lipopolysaccharide/colanic/teichoic acid biosynthesis glycosyltransferase